MEIKSKLDKSDYYDIGLILLFSLYAYLFMGKIFSSWALDLTTDTRILSLSSMNVLIILAVFIYLLYKSSSKISGSEYNYGFSIGKSCWIQLGVISIIGVIMILNDNTIVPSIDAFVKSIFFILTIICAEIVLKGILFSFIYEIFPVGNNKYGISILLSVLLFTMVFSNVISFDVYTVASFIATTLIFIGTRNLFFVIFWDAYILFPNTELINGFALAFVVMIILLYFALTIPAHFMQKRKPKENILTSQT